MFINCRHGTCRTVRPFEGIPLNRNADVSLPSIVGLLLRWNDGSSYGVVMGRQLELLLGEFVRHHDIPGCVRNCAATRTLIM